MCVYTFLYASIDSWADTCIAFQELQRQVLAKIKGKFTCRCWPRPLATSRLARLSSWKCSHGTCCHLGRSWAGGAVRSCMLPALLHPAVLPVPGHRLWHSARYVGNFLHTLFAQEGADCCQKAFAAKLYLLSKILQDLQSKTVPIPFASMLSLNSSQKIIAFFLL